MWAWDLQLQLGIILKFGINNSIADFIIIIEFKSTRDVVPASVISKLNIQWVGGCSCGRGLPGIRPASLLSPVPSRRRLERTGAVR